MLLQRVITAFVLIAVFLVVNFLLPELAFQAFASLLCLAAALEWARLGGLNHDRHKWIYCGAMLLLIVLVFQVRNSWGTGLIVFGALWWGFRAVLLITDRISNNKEKILLSGIWVLMIAWLSLVLIHQQSPALLLAGLVLVWGADSFAYFAGKKFGKNKLAPKISPGKTIEGVLGGTAGVIVLAIIIGMILNLDAGKWVWWILGAAGFSLISVVGDLYESWLKRNVGVKDSGTLLPGHGGVLDRVDGVIAVLPFYYLLVSWLFTNG